MTALTTECAVLRYGAVTALDRIDIRVRAGEMLALIGPNGAGKSSLLRVLAGLKAPDAGRVCLDGSPLDAIPARDRARRIGYLAQGAECHWPLTVGRLVALGRLPHLGPWQRPGAADVAAIEHALTACDVAYLADRPVTDLSGGERARVLLARVLASDPEILLADEPVAGLDPYHQLRVMKLLRRRTSAGTGIAVVLHDLTLAARFCDRIVLLHGGRVLADGDPAAVLGPELLERVYGVTVTHIEINGRRLYIPLEPCPSRTREPVA